MRQLIALFIALLILPLLFACSEQHTHDHEHSDHLNSHSDWHTHAHSADTHATSAHQHGRGDLEIVLEGSFVLIRGNLPASDILGFEHEPQTEQEQAHFNEQQEYLMSSDWLILSGNAQCEFADAILSFGGNKSGHGDLIVSARYSCQQPSRLQYIDTQLFERYSSLNLLNVVWLTEQTQGVASLTPAQTRLRLTP